MRYALLVLSPFLLASSASAGFISWPDIVTQVTYTEEPDYVPSAEDLEDFHVMLRRYANFHMEKVLPRIELKPFDPAKGVYTRYENGAWVIYVMSKRERTKGYLASYEPTVRSLVLLNIEANFSPETRAEYLRLWGSPQNAFDSMRLGYNLWNQDSRALLEYALSTGAQHAIETAMFNLGIFTNPVTRMITLWENGAQHDYDINVTPDMIAFAGYRIFLSSGSVTGWQIGNNPKVANGALYKLAPSLASLAAPGRFLTRSDISILFTEGTTPDSRWTDTEKTRVNSILNALPYADVKRIDSIQTVVRSSAASQAMTVTGGRLVYTLPPVSERYTKFGYLESEIARGVGHRTYQALSTTERNDYTAMLSFVGPFSDFVENSFAADYATWVRRDPLGLVYGQIANGFDPEGLDRYLFMASFYIDKNRQEVTRFELQDDGSVQAIANYVARSVNDNFLRVGPYEFWLQNGQVTHMRYIAATDTGWKKLTRPVDVPQRLLDLIVQSPNPSNYPAPKTAVGSGVSARSVVAPASRSAVASPSVTPRLPARSSGLSTPVVLPSPLTYMPVTSEMGQKRLRRALTQSRKTLKDQLEFVDPANTSPHPVTRQ